MSGIRQPLDADHLRPRNDRSRRRDYGYSEASVLCGCDRSFAQFFGEVRSLCGREDRTQSGHSAEAPDRDDDRWRVAHALFVRELGKLDEHAMSGRGVHEGFLPIGLGVVESHDREAE